MIDLSKIQEDLTSVIKLTNLQAKIFLLIVTEGKMTAKKISNTLRISIDDAYSIGKQLIELGSLIEISENEFEAMHPRFTAVNMYRKMCEREKVEFKRNVTVDNIGVLLERPYDDARTKYNKN
ncbi:MAG: helix-turn-helix domain-containing protein [Nitrosopumilus sp.]|jgi:sugar-specific transcriptional regulator TrmB